MFISTQGPAYLSKLIVVDQTGANDVPCDTSSTTAVFLYMLDSAEIGVIRQCVWVNYMYCQRKQNIA